jgi:hypothetical protein
MADDPLYSATPPFETASLRKELKAFLDSMVTNPVSGAEVRLGSHIWGVYAFYDYDGEPIYIGQTKESLGTRIRRHLTNQRTDAVAMNVLDPLEVHTVRVWPLPEFEGKAKSDGDACAALDGLERHIYEEAIKLSHFGAVLNEKEPPLAEMTVELPDSFDGCIVSDQVFQLRRHADVRIARRAQVISRLAQVIEERKVNTDLRRVFVTQAKRLTWLAEQRLEGVTKGVPKG